MNSLRVVLVSPRNPLNIGAAARAMSNFGFPSLCLVNPYEVAFREARSAVGAAAVIRSAVEYPSVAEAVAGCSLVVGATALGHRQLKHPLRRLEYGARLIRRHPGPVALLFGSEKFGLSNEDLSYCHWLIRIPTRPGHESMNLGQAVSVCLYELVRDSRVARRSPKAPKKAPAHNLDLLTDSLLEILARAGYTNPRTAASTAAKIRRLIRRMDLTSADSQVWLGILRQIRWKMNRDH